MIEVEIRARINDINSIKTRLSELGAEFVKSKKQVDRVFGHSHFLDENKFVIEGGLSSRIRQVDDKVSLDFKEICRKSGGIEVRSQLNSVETGLKFLEKLGFEEAFTVAKSREEYSYNDLILCLDKVALLGNFIEIEKTVNSSAEQEKAREECLELLNKIHPGLEIENKKYGDLMQEKINKKEI